MSGSQWIHTLWVWLSNHNTPQDKYLEEHSEDIIVMELYILCILIGFI